MEKNFSDKTKEIREALKGKNFCVVYDTNIYLNLYEYSPEATDFFVGLTENIIGNLILPETVKREFDRNHGECLNRQRKKFKNVSFLLNKPLNQLKDKIKKQFDILKGYKFPNIEVLQNKIDEQISEIEIAFENYVSEHDTLNEINNRFLDDDKIKQIISKIMDKKNLLEAFTLDEIYLLCDEGENRYKKNIPPGYKDGVNKSGVQAYGDLLIWKEVMRYCKEKQMNLIFVTDDVKEDWFELRNTERVGFRKELTNEFKTQTSKEVIGVTSNEFFIALAEFYNQEIPTTAEWALSYDIENYIEQIIDWGIVDDIVEELIMSGSRFVAISTLSGYDGSAFEIQDELIKNELVSFEFEGYYDEFAEYLLKFNIEIEAISQQYWGRDEDTKEVILSDSRTHKLKGEISVKVTRKIESYLDELVNDHIYERVEIVEGILEEINSYTSEELCVECGKNVGSYHNYYGDPICESCMVIDNNGDICPMCGLKVPFEKMGEVVFVGIVRQKVTINFTLHSVPKVEGILILKRCAKQNVIIKNLEKSSLIII